MGLEGDSDHNPHAESRMTTFDDREKAYEKKFALDQDLKFRAESRRNRLLAEWAAAKLGIMGAALPDYVKAVVRADLQEKGDDDVFRKIRKDFDDAGVSCLGRRAAGQDGRVPGHRRGRYRGIQVGRSAPLRRAALPETGRIAARRPARRRGRCRPRCARPVPPR